MKQELSNESLCCDIEDKNILIKIKSLRIRFIWCFCISVVMVFALPTAYSVFLGSSGIGLSNADIYLELICMSVVFLLVRIIFW